MMNPLEVGTLVAADQASGGDAEGSSFPSVDPGGEYLSAPRIAANHVRPGARPGPFRERPSSTSRRVLVVEDNLDSAQALATLLELNGYEVRTAHEGAAALDLARSFKPNVILLDIGLPGIDGYEVARRLRGLTGMDKMVLLAMTGYAQDREKSRLAGFDDHMIKPVSPDELLRVISNC